MIKVGHLSFYEIYDRVMWIQQTIDDDDSWSTDNRDFTIAFNDPKMELLYILRWGA